MEERVKQFLDKEHSKRFRTMCHKNETIANEAKTLLDFYENEKKKSLHNLNIESNELQKKMLKYSQEKLVNGLLNKLTDLAFQDNVNCNESGSQIKVTKVESLVSTEVDDSTSKGCPRYLRMETNPFHPSYISLGSSDSFVSSTDSGQDVKVAKTRSESDTDNAQHPIPSSKTEDKIKDVVEKLTGHYNIDRLKSLTQILVKSLQSSERARYEDKMKLIYNLSKYLNQDEDTTAEAVKSKTSLHTPHSTTPKATGNNMFLFLKSDRRSELIRSEKEKSEKEKSEKATVTESIFTSPSKGTNLSEKARINRLSSPLISQQSQFERGYSFSEKLPSNSVLIDRKRPVNQDGSLEKIINYNTEEPNDVMKSIYLKLGHENLLKLPRYSRQMAIAKQRSYLRRDLRKIPILPTDGTRDLRVVMKNCRYIRFPKDMQHEHV